MAERAATPRLPGTLGWFPLLGAWLVPFHRIATHTWGHGPATFTCLIASLVLLLFAATLGRLLGRILVTSATGWIILAGLFLLLIYTAQGLRRELDRPDNQNWILDVASNTHDAGTLFLEGRNPYGERIQPHAVTRGPHVEIKGDRVLMYGVPYTYGFPYFPAMFLSYLPFRALVSGFHSIRIGNCAFLLLTVGGILYLVRRLGPSGAPWTGALAACVASLGIKDLPGQLFGFGVTDLVIAFYAVYGFIALTRNRFLLAGILFGLCQACKLLPGPLLILPVLLWLYRKHGFAAVALGYVVTSALCLLPFVLWGPGPFLSSTILFYMTHHGGGDSTSLWFFLPEALKGPFTLLGFALSAGFALFAARRRSEGLVWPLFLGYSSYLTFMAFAPMTHLNYLWGIYPLGCAALAIRFSSGIEQSRSFSPVASVVNQG